MRGGRNAVAMPAASRLEGPRRRAVSYLGRGCPLELLVFVVGASSLGAEIAAARLLAPVLRRVDDRLGEHDRDRAGGAVDRLLGRRAAGRPRPDAARRCAGSCWPPRRCWPSCRSWPGRSCRVAVDALDASSAGAFVGSLLGVLVLVAVPVLLLGAVAPYAIRLRVRRVEESGAIAGRLYAISTVGSLVGTFLAALLLIPLVGTQRTFLALRAGAGRGRGGPALGRALRCSRRSALAALLALPVGTVKAAERRAGDLTRPRPSTSTRAWSRTTDGERRLELNEGQAVHSLLPAGRPCLTGDYWDELPRAAVRGRPRAAAAGRDPRQRRRHDRARLRRTTSRTRAIDAVEIDGELTEIGRR